MTQSTVKIGHFIGGETVSGGADRESINPSKLSDIVATAPQGGEAQINAAVDAARAAQPAWAAASPEVRADVLDKASHLLAARAAEIGEQLSREEGKTRPEGMGETMRAARILRYFAGEALRLHGQNLPSTRPGVRAGTRREAVGVFGLITPWNFPIAIPAWKAAPALAFGNAVVLKPSEFTPLLVDILAKVLAEAGLPAGVFNVVHGAGEAGAALVNHKDIDGISFTGSQATGGKIAMAAAQTLTPIQMEMGGKNPLVVLDDADIDTAVAVALDGAFFSTGQRCTASSRLIVTESVHDQFVEALAAKVSGLKVGEALAEGTQIGPVISQAQFDKVKGYEAVAKDTDGAEQVACADAPSSEAGYFIAPALYTGVSADMRINREEIFGPVAGVVKVADADAALAMANDTEMGLSAGVVTQSLKDAERFQSDLKAGMVMVNLPTAGVDYHVPFGGWKGSSFGAKEQAFAAQEFYTRSKTSYLKA